MNAGISQESKNDWILMTRTSHGVVMDGFAPHAAALVFVGSDFEFVGRVGLEIVNDCVASGACLVDPFPVPFSVADRVEPGRMFLANSIIFHSKSTYQGSR